jgi:hypothetical protein
MVDVGDDRDVADGLGGGHTGYANRLV